MAFPRPEDYKTHNGPTGSPADWQRKANRVLRAARKGDSRAMKALAVLGLDSLPSDPLDLKKAYRHAAMKNHPDHGGTPEAFRAVQEAYELLTNLRA